MRRQVYMMLKDNTCMDFSTLILPLQFVPKWHYGLKPPPNSIIHYSPFLKPLSLVNYYDRAYFWSYKFSPLESNTERKVISSTWEGQTL